MHIHKHVHKYIVHTRGDCHLWGLENVSVGKVPAVQSLFLSTHVKKPKIQNNNKNKKLSGMAANACLPTAGEPGAGELPGFAGQPVQPNRWSPSSVRDLFHYWPSHTHTSTHTNMDTAHACGPFHSLTKSS